MKTAKTATFVDKSDWGDGLWQDEPDRVEWREGDLVALALRGPGGAWCGYVGVPPGHPYHGKDYDDVDVDVHGGLTYARECMDLAEVKKYRPEETHDSIICHVPEEDEPEELWWLGFDCSHAGDYAPRHERSLAKVRDEAYRSEYVRHLQYRDLSYVKNEVLGLVRQVDNARVAAERKR